MYEHLPADQKGSQTTSASDLICKETTVTNISNISILYKYNCYICIAILLCMQNCCLVSLNSCVLTNLVTNILTEAVPFCKSSHI